MGFLEGRELKDLALQVSNDPEHRFELAMQCHKFAMAREILLESESELKWKQLGDAALNHDFNLQLAEECYVRSKDFGGLLLLYTSLCDQKGMEKLGKMAKENGHNNVAFLCLFLTNRIRECIDLLCETDRIPEAAFMTRTYLPSQITRVLALWKDDLKKVSVKAAESLGDPHDYEELCPDLKWSLKVEKWLQNRTMGKDGTPKLLPANQYQNVKDNLFPDLIQQMKDGILDENDIVETMPEADLEADVNVDLEADVNVDLEADVNADLEADHVEADLEADLGIDAEVEALLPEEPKDDDSAGIQKEEDIALPELEEASELQDILQDAEDINIEEELVELVGEEDINEEDMANEMSIEDLDKDLLEIEAQMGGDEWGDTEQF